MSDTSGDRIKSEWDILKRIRSLVTEKSPVLPGLVEGIGDDCAVYRLGEDRYGLFTTDISIEGVHFISGRMSYQDIAFKAMTGNLSDIAAMGGSPLMAFVSLGLPADFSQKSIDDLYTGFISCANPSGTVIAGGDVSRSRDLVINIALYGEINGRLPVTRKGARPGDLIVLTGDTGASKAGLDIIMSGDSSLQAGYPGLIEKHTRPSARLNEAHTLLQLDPGAMIDISDGLVSDLRHICDASGTGFILFEDRLPLRDDLGKYCMWKKTDPLEMMTQSGEEYELLFTVRPYTDVPGRIGSTRLTVIGEIKDSGFVISNAGVNTAVSPDGWDHFK